MHDSLTAPLLIGLTTKHGNAEWVEKNTHNYLAMLAELGATPVLLSPDAPARLPDGTRYAPDSLGRLPGAVLDHLDGLILSGGGDVHPRYFGAELAGANPDTISEARDELELALARQALAQDLPLFGICRGCQVLNVAAGGGMVQDFPNHRSSTENPVLHQVALSPQSRLAGMIGSPTLAVNTYHHQGVDGATLAPGMRAAAFSCAPDDWLIEAFESPSHRWVVGVQWHPERIFELPDGHRRLWGSFVDACQEGKKGK
ncbi:MAG: gamma-glutamyl-gamma-aminobutyrate hydrolase family protein [Caldilineaceae bacterium]|nr:gamma-glutamyl-gamma-aminobutyrate hydrolase family protein [Caldilineaceae bacterium]HRJ42913.1 gamma-glutamyl-gamma-aminobutyrate hydrolase family protein [Caldilineaceae bacterium]